MRLAIPVVMSVIIGAAAGSAAPIAGAQQLPSSCDGGYDGSVSAQASLDPVKERFDLAPQGADGRGEKQLAPATGTEGLRRQFIQADDDGDGRINREEWRRWFGPAHAGLAAGAGRRSSGTD